MGPQLKPLIFADSKPTLRPSGRGGFVSGKAVAVQSKPLSRSPLGLPSDIGHSRREWEVGKRRKTGNQNKSISFFDHKKHLMGTYFKMLISFFSHISDTCLTQFTRADTDCLPPVP